MFRFANDTYLYLLLLIPVLVLYYTYIAIFKRDRVKIGDLELIKKLSPSFSKSDYILNSGFDSGNIICNTCPCSPTIGF